MVSTAFYLGKEKLRHSLGRPSRSDFVQFLFTDGDINIEVELSPELETVWLTQKQMGELFEVKQVTLSEHINNIISSGELDETSIGFSDKSSGRRKPKIGCDYAYDCRVKTRRKRYNGESCNEFFDNVVSS